MSEAPLYRGFGSARAHVEPLKFRDSCSGFGISGVGFEGEGLGFQGSIIEYKVVGGGEQRGDDVI